MASWLLLSAWIFSGLARGASWPDLSEPAVPVGGGERDAAVVRLHRARGPLQGRQGRASRGRGRPAEGQEPRGRRGGGSRAPAHGDREPLRPFGPAVRGADGGQGGPVRGRPSRGRAPRVQLPGAGGTAGLGGRREEERQIPRATLPSLAGAGSPPRVDVPKDMGSAGGLDFGSVDVEDLGRYDEAVKFEKGDATAEAKSAKWRALGAGVKTYAEAAAKRAAEWDDYAAQAARTRSQEWERYARELEAAEEARQKRAELRDKDWAKLSIYSDSSR